MGKKKKKRNETAAFLESVMRVATKRMEATQPGAVRESAPTTGGMGMMQLTLGEGALSLVERGDSLLLQHSHGAAARVAHATLKGVESTTIVFSRAIADMATNEAQMKAEMEDISDRVAKSQAQQQQQGPQGP